MSTLTQKIVYTTIGAASVTNEKFKELLEDLIQNNQFTEEEGKRIVDNFFIDFRERVDTFNTSVQIRINDFVNRFNVANIHTIKEDIENYIQSVKTNPTTFLKLPNVR